jgi:hypothetical protein
MLPVCVAAPDHHFQLCGVSQAASGNWGRERCLEQGEKLPAPLDNWGAWGEASECLSYFHNIGKKKKKWLLLEISQGLGMAQW